MKKLNRKSTVHPSPPIRTQHLSLLPAALLTLAASLSPADLEVLAYLVSSETHRHNPADHRPLSNCNCFTCYTTYWARWDSSPNRHLIHDIIDSLEASSNHKKPSSKKDRKKRPTRADSGSGSGSTADSKPESGLVEESGPGGRVGDAEEGSEKGSVRKIVSFIGEKIWGIWG